jgi:hypothetical protein
MNYQEISQLAISQEWAAKYKAKIDADNVAILATRQSYLDNRQSIGVGDFVTDDEKSYRVAHHWGDSLQLTDGRYGASFYLGDGYVEFSGGLNPCIDIARFEPTEERHEGAVWLFSENHTRAHNGYHTTATFRVWKLKA